MDRLMGGKVVRQGDSGASELIGRDVVLQTDGPNKGDQLFSEIVAALGLDDVTDEGNG